MKTDAAVWFHLTVLKVFVSSKGSTEFQDQSAQNNEWLLAFKAGHFAILQVHMDGPGV